MPIMKSVLLVGGDPNFFENSVVLDRRGVLMFPAMTIKEASVTFNKTAVHLVLVDGVTQANGVSVISDLATLPQVVAAWPATVPVVYIAGSRDDPAALALRQNKVSVEVMPAASDAVFQRRMIVLTAKALGLVRRCDASHCVAQFWSLSKLGEKAAKRGQPNFGFVRNVGPSGLLLESQTAIQIGDAVVVSFTLPKVGSFDLQGAVVRIGASSQPPVPCYGIQLVHNTPPAVTDKLIGFCRG